MDRFQSEVSETHWRMTGILAVLLAVSLAAPRARAADATLRDTGLTGLEITGGSGASAWRLRYGTSFTTRPHSELVRAGAQTFFIHGSWLRQIDTRRGVVTGRWRFPWQIARVVPENGKLRVEIAQSLYLARTFQHTVILDPKSPQIPNWPGKFYALPISEATAPWRLAITGPAHSINFKIPPERAKELIPELEDMVQRDPFSPWYRVTLAVLLQAVGEARASAVYRDAISIPGTDFTELLRISAFLMQVGEKESARKAFEHGYRDFWERGNDPRLLQAVWTRSELFPRFGLDAEGMERAYRLAPNSEDAARAWQGVAVSLFGADPKWQEHLEKQGRSEEARLWRRRAADSASHHPLFRFPMIALLLAIAIPSSGFAIVAYVVILAWRYAPQRLHDRRAGSGWQSKPGVTLLHLEYTDRRERAVLLWIALLGWTAVGLVIGLSASWQRLRHWEGAFSGPVNVWFLENRLPAGKDRDLLLALAHQQGGDYEKAERLYRSLPDFPESWNNLGVLLKKAGKDQEARAAFEQALLKDPGLFEATLNLRGTAGDQWTAEHTRLFPGQPMAAIPRPDRLTRAYLGGSWTAFFLRSLAGPLAIDRSGAERWSPPWTIPMHPLPTLRISFPISVSLLTAFLLVFPRLRVTQPGSRSARIAGFVVPGSARAWLGLGGFMGALLMTAWWWLFNVGMLATKILRGPGRAWPVAVMVAMFAVNLVVVRRRPG